MNPTLTWEISEIVNWFVSSFCNSTSSWLFDFKSFSSSSNMFQSKKTISSSWFNLTSFFEVQIENKFSWNYFNQTAKFEFLFFKSHKNVFFKPKQTKTFKMFEALMPKAALLKKIMDAMKVCLEQKKNSIIWI